MPLVVLSYCKKSVTKNRTSFDCDSMKLRPPMNDTVGSSVRQQKVGKGPQRPKSLDCPFCAAGAKRYTSGAGVFRGFTQQALCISTRSKKKGSFRSKIKKHDKLAFRLHGCIGEFRSANWENGDTMFKFKEKKSEGI